MQTVKSPIIQNTQNVFFITKKPDIKSNQTLPVKNAKISHPQKVFANHLQARGINFKGLNMAKAIDDYKWFINVDRTSPFNSFLKITTEMNSADDLFQAILKDDDLSYHFINDLAKDPRNLNNNYDLIQEKIGKNSTSLLLFLPKNEYSLAFSKFMDRKVSDAKSIESLLKIRPDWKEEVLLDKFKQLKGHNNFEIGNIPKEFEDGTFHSVVNYLKTFSQRGFKQKTQIPSLQIGNKNFDFEFFTEGKTDKNVFGVYTQGKKFVIKTAEEGNKSLNKPYSLGVLALIDNYSTLNRCRNSAPIYYYNHDMNTSIYKFIEHNQVNHKISSAKEVNAKMPDFEEIGLFYHDTLGSNNYFVLEQNIIGDSSDFYNNGLDFGKELMSVDNDHVTYNKKLMPKVEKYNKELPNEMNNAF